MSRQIIKYLKDLRSNTLLLERTDINGSIASSSFAKYFRRVGFLLVSGIIIYKLGIGFSTNFISYASTVLSILIGLFINAIIFSLDKFHQYIDRSISVYDISINNDNATLNKDYKFAIKNVTQLNANQELSRKQSYNYTKQFAFITGYNIVLCVFTIILLLLCTLFPSKLAVNIHHYRFIYKNFDGRSICNFLLLTFVILQRILILYWILRVMYNTLFLVSSMVNFMTVKIDKSNV